MKRAGLSGHTTYDLRHTFASLLLQNLAPVPYVAKQLGHANSVTTLRYYAHAIPGGDKRFVDALDSQVGTNSGTNFKKTHVEYTEMPSSDLSPN
jgi:integrase